MNSFAKRKPLVASFLAGALLLCFSPAAWADEGDYLVEYEGGAEGLVTVEDDFFSHFPDLLPGDVVDGAVSILNTSDAAKEVFFYTEPTEPSGNARVDELLDLLSLSIVSLETGEMLYEGPIRADSLNDPVSLGSFAVGESGAFSFEVSVPLSLGEEYLSLGNKVHWVFAVEEDPAAPEKPAAFSETGDNAAAIALLLLLSIKAGLISAFILVKTRKSAMEERSLS